MKVELFLRMVPFVGKEGLRAGPWAGPRAGPRLRVQGTHV